MAQLAKIGDVVETIVSIQTSVCEFTPGLVGTIVKEYTDAFDVEFRMMGFSVIQTIHKDYVKPI